MRRGPTGTWLTSLARGETVRAFVPVPLPPKPPLEFDPQRQQRLEQALLALGLLDAIAALFAAVRQRLLGLGRTAPNALRVFDVLRHRPVGNIKLLAERTWVNFTTAMRAVEALERLGIVREVTGRARERVFVYGGYLDLFTQEGLEEWGVKTRREWDGGKL